MVTIEVTVKTGAPTTKILKEEGNTLIIAIKERAEHNKANMALLKFLRKHYKQSATIIKGHTNKHKIILLD
ncbi:MAG: DUF167 domain-containing protein [Nanoarchaeota archaeon]|nr:DUF167 domain-containing protein [Nanoarchaeota archaeon]